MLGRSILVFVCALSLSLAGCDEIVTSNSSLESPEESSSQFNMEAFQSGMNKSPSTILDIAAGNEDFSILAQAVTFAGLDETLDGRRQFTVFAPTNDAFVALLESLGLTAEELLAEENKELVKNILLYHVAPGNRDAEDVIDSDKIQTLLKKFAEVNVDDGEVFIGNNENGFAKIVTTDIKASNGIIHVIDAVLQPPSHKRSGDDDDDDERDGKYASDTILDIAASNDNFSVLAQAVGFSGLDKALDGRRQLTVFAPTNDAFAVLLDALDLTAEELFVPENKQLVTDILLYHVAPGNRDAEDVVESDKVRTLLKKFIEVNVDNGNVTIGNDENGFANVIATDIFASNGVIHVIDGVLIPPSKKNYGDDDDDDDD